MVWSLLYGLTRNTLGVMPLRIRGDACACRKFGLRRTEIGSRP